MSNNPFKKIYLLLASSRLIKSSFWGIAANGIQTILLSLFFVVMARKYSDTTFATFLIATTIYQFLAAFSTLGLGQWFTREIVHTTNKEELINKFLKMQIYSGAFFYLVNVAIAYTLYKDPNIQHLTIILGINIIFDNIIYAIRSLNVAEFKQQKSFYILLIDSILKFLASCILFVYPLPVISLSVILIAIRFFTLNIFLGVGSSNTINLKQLLFYKISLAEIKKIAAPNWAFIIIGSVSMVYWRIGNLIISKTLPLGDVANYEISYRVFSIALILPLIVSTTVFPSLVELNKPEIKEKFNAYFHKVFLLYFLYSLLTFTFFYSFSDFLIPFAFGQKYIHNPQYTKEMFLTVLIFPTALLQANVLVSIHKEKIDMWLNIVSLGVNVLFCLVGLYFYKSLTVVNFAVFFSFLIFHVCQDILLIRNKITNTITVFKFYGWTLLTVLLYVFLSTYLKPLVLFPLFWIIAIGVIIELTIKFSGLWKFLKNPKSIHLKN